MGATKISLRAPDTAGIANSMELAMRFIGWAQSLGHEPTAADIQNRFGLSRAAAYRWRQAWNAVSSAYPTKGN